MMFEKIMQSLFHGRGSDRMSLARHFNAGMMSATVLVAAATVDIANWRQPSLPRLKLLCDQRLALKRRARIKSRCCDRGGGCIISQRPLVRACLTFQSHTDLSPRHYSLFRFLAFTP